MTILEAINGAKKLRPGQVSDTGVISDADLINALGNLDLQISLEVAATHEDAPEEEFVPYVGSGEGATPTSTVLLVAAPYSRMYIPFLCSKIDWAASEMNKYNNSLQQFNADYADFTAAYNRAHTPLQNHSIAVSKYDSPFAWPAELR